MLSRAPLRRRAPFPPPRKLRWTRRSARRREGGRLARFAALARVVLRKRLQRSALARSA